MNNPSPNLDVLRSIAVTFVVISHLLLDNSMVKIGSYHVQTLGTLGVLIFFVHTCLVLMQSLDRHSQMDGHQTIAMSFMIRRAFRIFPMSIVVVLVLSSIEWIHSHAHPAWSTMASNLFLVQNLTDSPSVTPVLWSLPFEFQMYFFLPALHWLVNSRKPYGWCWILALWGVSIASVYVFWQLGWRADLIKFFPCFLPGVLAYSLRNRLRRWAPGALFSYVGAIMLFYPTMVGLGFSATFFSWFICLALGFIVPMCREVQRAWLKVCAAVVARYSYGVYLVHVPVIYLSFHYLKGMPFYLEWMCFIFGVPALSYAAYHLIERPGIEFGQALADRLHVSSKAVRA